MLKSAESKDVYVGLINRLDRPVSGLQLLGKTKVAAQILSKEFQNRQNIDKYYVGTTTHSCLLTYSLTHSLLLYLAVVNGAVSSKLNEVVSLVNYMDKGDKVRVFDQPNPSSVDAKLNYQLIHEINTEKYKQRSTYSLTHSLTHLLTHLLTYSLTYSLTHSLTHSFTYLLTYLL